VPVIVTEVPAMPVPTVTLVIMGTTVKATPLLAPPFTVTVTFPVVAAVGTGTTMEVAFQFVGVATAAPNVTVLLPCDPPKPVPVIVTEVPTVPDLVESEVMTGNAVPVPVKLTVCGLLLALSVIVKVPGCEPVVAGLNVTLTVQVPCAASKLPHVLVSE
jgi:hypothetical protein